MKYSELLKTKPVKRDDIREVVGDGNRDGRYQWNDKHFKWLRISDVAQTSLPDSEPPQESTIVKMGRAQLLDYVHTLGYNPDSEELVLLFAKYKELPIVKNTDEFNVIIRNLIEEVKQELAVKKDEETLDANTGADTTKVEELLPVQTDENLEKQISDNRHPPEEPLQEPEKPVVQTPTPAVQTPANPVQTRPKTAAEKIQEMRLRGGK